MQPGLTSSAADRKQEIGRLLALGARRVGMDRPVLNPGSSGPILRETSSASCARRRRSSVKAERRAPQTHLSASERPRKDSQRFCRALPSPGDLPTGLTREIQIGLGLFVVLLAAVGDGASCADTDRPGLGLGGPVIEYPSAPHRQRQKSVRVTCSSTMP